MDVNECLYLLTQSIQHSPFEANKFPASQEIPHILRNLTVHYHIHKCPPPVPLLTQPNPVHTPTSHFLNIHLNSTLPSTLVSPQWSLFLRFSHQNPLHTSSLSHPSYMPRPSNSCRFSINGQYLLQCQTYILPTIYMQISATANCLGRFWSPCCSLHSNMLGK